MADGAYAVLSDELAPKGYAYLLVCNGRGTLASCLFDDFHHEHAYVERCRTFFEEHVGVRMQNPHRFGGSGNFSLPKRAHKGGILYAGEAAGFQDPLFGFGMRWALLSGAAAGRAMANDDVKMYETFWKRRLRDYYQTAATNRWLYARLGDRGYNAVLRRFPDTGNVRDYLRQAYAPDLLKRLWYRLVLEHKQSAVLTVEEGCDCTWCRCRRHEMTTA
jgi:flavin-dependent dehydrogenase